jgi:hypothetical protein
MAPFRNRPGPLTKYAVNQAACPQNLSGSSRYPCGTTCGQNSLVETTARSIVSTSPKKRPNFNQYGGLSRGLWQGLLLISLKASEESPIFYALRSFALLRMTKRAFFLQLASFHLPLPTGNCPLATAHCLRLTAYCLLLTAPVHPGQLVHFAPVELQVAFVGFIDGPA